MPNGTLDVRQLRQAVANNSVSLAVLEADDTGYGILIEDTHGVMSRLIAVNEQTPRRYVDPLRALRFLDKVGIHEAKMVLAERIKDRQAAVLVAV